MLETASLPLCYLVCGFLHELSHLVASGWSPATTSVGELLWQLTLGRHVVLETLDPSVRHAGWITSLFLALLLQLSARKMGISSEGLSNLRWAAWITAVEAIGSDLLQLDLIRLPGFASHTSNTIFYCGNFGIILLHHAWLTDQGKSALDILDTMIRVTMVRGAQAGGVVAFTENRYKDKIGIRVRVINRKRTDLSKWLRRLTSRKIIQRAVKEPNQVLSLVGHTRFATSGLPSLEGTHPHQWTRPALHSVYDFDVPHYGTVSLKPTSKRVELFVTHNGDFDFYSVNGLTYDLSQIQAWLPLVTKTPMPASVDSCSIAGVMDLLRTQASFALSARYAVALGMPKSRIFDDDSVYFPSTPEWRAVGKVFEKALGGFLKRATTTLTRMGDSEEFRQQLAEAVSHLFLELKGNGVVEVWDILSPFVSDEENSDSLELFCRVTVDAFFDNDLFMATKMFMKYAEGSFGLAVSCSLDAHRQICIAARGQPMSVAFYPSKGIIAFGSEQACVKAGIGAPLPQGDWGDVLRSRHGILEENAFRLDLDDLGGEILCLDWGLQKYKNGPVSKPNRFIRQDSHMYGQVIGILYQESPITKRGLDVYRRMTQLTGSHVVKPLEPDFENPIEKDIREIPMLCEKIQGDWDSEKGSESLNRLTAFHFSSCLRNRIEERIQGKLPSNAIDIIVTGCEVSLWLAEQFVADLQKCFPKLEVMSVSSNKILGLFGQKMSIPTIGYPMSSRKYDFSDTIVLIVSHSGGTFAPLACSNLLQSSTRHVFVATSEWDTQIGKQLRAMDTFNDMADMLKSRIFTTETGMRPAEPCSLTVVAMHQLLTQLLEYISAVILSSRRYIRATGAVITEGDLQILERCNQDNVDALCRIVGHDIDGEPEASPETDYENLRMCGRLWADHVLEVARAYAMTIVYILVTVITGFPLAYAIAFAAGIDESSGYMYLVRSIDAIIYISLPQINVIILRLIQGRNLRHRMVGRTVVIGDIPWVAQCADAFLSKIFACSYSIAGVNVLHGNPSDHLVHRHTHRVVRGSLLVCGRPDGRLSALSSAEASVCLSVNQASSIQSWGGTCESITIGHNPYKLPLSHIGIFLKRMRPQFLCEKFLAELDESIDKSKRIMKGFKSDEGDLSSTEETTNHGELEEIRERTLKRRSMKHQQLSMWNLKRKYEYTISNSQRDLVHAPKDIKLRSAAGLMGAYQNFEEQEKRPTLESLSETVQSAIDEKKFSDEARKLYHDLDENGDGFLSEEEWMSGMTRLGSGLSKEELKAFYAECNQDGGIYIDFHEFVSLLRIAKVEHQIKVPPSHTDERGMIQLVPTDEHYFGEELRKLNSGKGSGVVEFQLAKSQHLAQELYESRIASMQRFVAMTVMFHEMGKTVEQFFERFSFGMFGYRMDRTHSIMRIATTASPVSGADVRLRMEKLQLLRKVQHSLRVISRAYLNYKERKKANRLEELEAFVSMSSIELDEFRRIRGDSVEDFESALGRLHI